MQRFVSNCYKEEGFLRVTTNVWKRAHAKLYIAVIFSTDQFGQKINIHLALQGIEDICPKPVSTNNKAKFVSIRKLYMNVSWGTPLEADQWLTSVYKAVNLILVSLRKHENRKCAFNL